MRDKEQLRGVRRHVIRARKQLASISRWFARGRWYWPAVLLTAFIFLLLMFDQTLLGCKERDVRILGLSLQVYGFIIVARRLREVGRNFSKPSAIAEVRRYFSEFPIPRREAKVVGRITAAGGTSRMHARGFSVPAPGSPIESRVELLERNMISLHEELGQVGSAQRDLKANTERALKKEAEEREQVETDLRQSIETTIAGGVYLEKLGVVLFLLGIILATAAPEIASLLGAELSCSMSLPAYLREAS